MGLAREARLIVCFALYISPVLLQVAGEAVSQAASNESGRRAAGWRVLHILGAERPARTGRAFSGPSLFVFY
jgi:hypothetical protein